MCPYLLIGQGYGRRNQVLSVYMYVEAFTGATPQLGYGSAIAAIILIINLIIATFYLRAGRSRR